MRILIADDNHEFRQLLCIALHDHHVMVAEDGAEAIAKAECYLPDIVLMDVMMPGVDGFEALRQLKADEVTADIPVVLMSAGHIRRQDVALGRELGATDYLQKPFYFGISNLSGVLEGCVAKKKARDRTRARALTTK